MVQRQEDGSENVEDGADEGTEGVEDGRHCCVMVACWFGV